ncbi:MAG TPA: thioredoxin [Bacteroidetes bacterium]|nr:thioredoxin [Bacteroidota bacterium]
MSMRSLSLVFLLLIVCFGCNREKKMKIVVNDRGERVAKGEYSEQQILDHFPQFKKNYLSYQPDTTLFAQLKQMSSPVEIVTILGTWCSDSRREVPKFMKLMDALQNKKITLSYICVDRTKRDEKGMAEKFNIEYVPTFIVLSDGKEIGRIIETPEITFEEDLSAIFSSLPANEK